MAESDTVWHTAGATEHTGCACALPLNVPTRQTHTDAAAQLNPWTAPSGGRGKTPQAAAGLQQWRHSFTAPPVAAIHPTTECTGHNPHNTTQHHLVTHIHTAAPCPTNTLCVATGTSVSAVPCEFPPLSALPNLKTDQNPAANPPNGEQGLRWGKSRSASQANSS